MKPTGKPGNGDNKNSTLMNPKARETRQTGKNKQTNHTTKHKSFGNLGARGHNGPMD